MKNRDKPLRIEVKNGQLSIVVGIDTLAFAFEQGDDNQRYSNQQYHKIWKVTDKTTFAKDVKNAMEIERDDGQTPIGKFLDSMCLKALDEGTVAVKLFEED